MKMCGEREEKSQSKSEPRTNIYPTVSSQRKASKWPDAAGCFHRLLESASASDIRPPVNDVM